MWWLNGKNVFVPTKKSIRIGAAWGWCLYKKPFLFISFDIARWTPKYVQSKRAFVLSRIKGMNLENKYPIAGYPLSFERK